jgi:NAD(P)-dependent dehydrogenase (short-subunit alcohol dehydrogenase family)
MAEGRLEGRHALVTGAGSGNGAAIARRLCADGAKTVLLDRSEEGIERTLAAWPDELRTRASGSVADITSDEQVRAAFESVERLDILVNNAGVVEPSTFPELDAATFSRVLDINLLGAYRCTAAARPLLAASPYGRVVNVTSMEAHWLLATGGHVQPHYNASKAGLDLLTKALAYEMAPDGVRVNAIAPGVIETPLTEHSLGNDSTADWIVSCVPVGRVGRPEDIAAVASFLASDDAEYVTGISVPVDGGWTMGWFRKPESTLA